MPVLVRYICKKCKAQSSLGDLRYTSEEKMLNNSIYNPSERQKKCNHEWKKETSISDIIDLARRFI